jgi:hypothetical protein
MFRQVLFSAGNKIESHPAIYLLTDFHGDKAKKKSKMADSKNIFLSPPIFNIFSPKF